MANFHGENLIKGEHNVLLFFVSCQLHETAKNQNFTK